MEKVADFSSLSTVLVTIYVSDEERAFDLNVFCLDLCGYIKCRIL